MKFSAKMIWKHWAIENKYAFFIFLWIQRIMKNWLMLIKCISTIAVITNLFETEGYFLVKYNSNIHFRNNDYAKFIS